MKINSFPPEHIVRVNLCEVVSDKLYQDITQGKYRIGDKLPNHDELARRWDVSRITIREAIKKLEAVGLVATRHGKGTFVTSTVGYGKPASDVPLILDAGTVMALIEARLVIEPALVRFAAERAEPRELEELDEVLKKMDEARSNEDSLEYAVFDSHFHRTIAQMAKSDVLYRLTDQLHRSIENQRRDMFEYTSSLKIQFRDETYRDHVRIADCIRQRNIDGADRAMRQHLGRVSEVVRDFFRSRDAENDENVT